ncbi:MAG: flagellar basal body P-ring formation protein FlgA [Rhodocyclaceae bacterium]|nr:flagellar basal body P-ring formation protein FlgA [Rhodocyclaceae bacterium]
MSRIGAALLSLTSFAVLLSSSVSARQPVAPVRDAVERLLFERAAGSSADVRVEVAPIDADNHLPACERLDAFMPRGRRAWGRTSVGVRCQAPVRWTIYVSARVQVFGDYLVLARDLRPGQLVAPEDLTRRHGDLTEDGAGALVDATQAVGHPARIAVAAGRPLTREMLRVPPVIGRGETVRVVTEGRGFQVANQGRALNDAGEGQVVRVRLPSGKVLSGRARLDGTVVVGP